MKAVKHLAKKTNMAVPLLGIALVALLSGCASLPDDGANAQMNHIDNLHGVPPPTSFKGQNKSGIYQFNEH